MTPPILRALCHHKILNFQELKMRLPTTSSRTKSVRRADGLTHSGNSSGVVIQAIEATIVDLPTVRQHRLSMTTMQKQTMVIIRLLCSDGIEGMGESTIIGGLSYGEESPESIKLHIDTYFTPSLAGRDGSNIHAAMALLDKQIKGNFIAKSGIETALLDAQGKRLGVSVASLLGGAIVHRLPVLWTLASGDTAKDIAGAEQWIACGRHLAFKLKVGWQEPAVATQHVLAIKKAPGSAVMVTVDVNQAWDETTAKKEIAKLQDGGVDLIEQPIRKDNIEGLARLTQRFQVPIMADEAMCTSGDAFRLASARAADVFAVKIGKSGGLFGALKTCAVAEAADVALYGGTLLEGTIGSVASAHAFSTLRSITWGTELFGPLLLADDIVKTKVEYAGGAMTIPSCPGLGLELDEEKLNHLQTEVIAKATQTRNLPCVFHVQMNVAIPYGILEKSYVDDLKAREKAMCQELQRKGQWLEIWRIVGRYANVSIFEMESPAELHEILSNLPLFPFMDIQVTALCQHYSSLKSNKEKL